MQDAASLFAFCYPSPHHAPASPFGCAQYAPPHDGPRARAPRHLHLNPLRARVAPDLLRALDRYPWTGHSALLGTVARPWQCTREILARFGAKVGRARRAYRDFVTAGVPLGHRPEFQGGGLLRSHGGWAAVAALRRGREAYLADERILGSSECRTGGGRTYWAWAPPRSIKPPNAAASRPASGIAVRLTDVLCLLLWRLKYESPVPPAAPPAPRRL